MYLARYNNECLIEIKKIKGSLAQQMAGQFILQREKDACLGTKRLGRPTTFFYLVDI